MKDANGKIVINIAIITGAGDSGKDTVLSEFKKRYYEPYAKSLNVTATSVYGIFSTVQFIKEFLQKNGIMKRDKCATLEQRQIISEIKDCLDTYHDTPNRIALTEVQSAIDYALMNQPTVLNGGEIHSFIFIQCREPHNINKLYKKLHKLKEVYDMLLYKCEVEINIVKIGIISDMTAGKVYHTTADDIAIDMETDVLYYDDGNPEFVKEGCQLNLVLRNDQSDEEPGVAAAGELAKFFKMSNC